LVASATATTIATMPIAASVAELVIGMLSISPVVEELAPAAVVVVAVLVLAVVVAALAVVVEVTLVEGIVTAEAVV